MFEIWDLIENKFYTFDRKVDVQKFIGGKQGETWEFLNRINKHMKSRFVLKDSPDVFTLVDYDSGEEFLCVCPKTLFLHFGIHNDRKSTNRICALRYGKHKSISFNGRILILKGVIQDKEAFAFKNISPQKGEKKC